MNVLAPWPTTLGLRLLADLETIGTVGRSADGAVNRVAFTPEFVAGRQLVEARMAEEGLTTWVDSAGNLFGRFGRGRPDAGDRVLLVGSHLDTVPDGGLFDGLYGVVAGLAALSWLVANHPQQAGHVALVGFCNEEGAFGTTGMTGSRAMSGAVGPDELSRPDEEGARLVDRLAAVATGDIGSSRWDAASLAGYLEVHVEQGPVLEAQQVPLGLVGTITGRVLFDISVRGTQAHAGATPMGLRADALAAAAEAILAVEKLGRSGTVRVATVGSAQCRPGSRNVIAGGVTLTGELRDSSGNKMAEGTEVLRAELANVASARGVAIELAVTGVVEPTLADPVLKQALARASARLGQATLDIDSGAGHDAQAVSDLTPIAMLFVPSRAGLSHCGGEWSNSEDLVLGAHVLAQALADLTSPESWGTSGTGLGRARRLTGTT